MVIVVGRVLHSNSGNITADDLKMVKNRNEGLPWWSGG